MSKIPWTEQTWNPIVGCSKVSPGCANCYAERMAARQASMGSDAYYDVVKQDILLSKYGKTKYNNWNGKTAFVESMLNKPLKRKKPTMFFVCSMGDFWHPTVLPEWRRRVYDVVRQCPQHIFQFLTKRPENIIYWPEDLPNAWLGVTAENQAMADERIPILLKIPAAKRFVSYEPALDGVDLSAYIYPGLFADPSEIGKDYPPIDWLIIGCESIGNRPGRECKIKWIESAVEQCKDADVPCFVKQIEVGGKLVKMPYGFPQQWPERGL